MLCLCRIVIKSYCIRQKAPHSAAQLLNMLFFLAHISFPQHVCTTHAEIEGSTLPSTLATLMRLRTFKPSPYTQQYTDFKQRPFYMHVIADSLPCSLWSLTVKLLACCRINVFLARTYEPRRDYGVYTNFEMGGTYEAVAVAFSADGATLFVVTSSRVFSIQEGGDNSVLNWSRETIDTDLCGIAVNGLSVRKRGTQHCSPNTKLAEASISNT